MTPILRTTHGNREGSAVPFTRTRGLAGKRAIPAITLIGTISLPERSLRGRAGSTSTVRITAPTSVLRRCAPREGLVQRTDAEPAIAVGLEWNAVDAAWIYGDLLHMEEVREQLAAGPNRGL